jgi:hypothetical protein
VSIFGDDLPPGVSLDDIEKHFGDEPPPRCRCGCGEAQGQCHFDYEEAGK